MKYIALIIITLCNIVACSNFKTARAFSIMFYNTIQRVRIYYDQQNQDIILLNIILYHNSIIIMVPAAVQQVICNEIKCLQKSS